MLLAVLFWAVNFSVIKIALEDFSPHGFNAPRLTIASLLLLFFLYKKEGRISIPRRDLGLLAGLGIIGNTFYQALFINGISRTTASTTSLVMTVTPILIALMSAVFIRERIHWAGWIGILISFGGLYLVVFGDAPHVSFSNEALQGNVMILAGNLCWAVYTVFSKPLLTRYSPLKLTSVTLAIGTLFYLPIAAKNILSLHADSPSKQSWAAVFLSAVFALAVGYLIWYSSVRRIGNTRTGIYSYITPVLTVLFAHFFLGEKIGVFQIVGTAVIFLGFCLTRFGDRWFGMTKASARPPS